MASPVQRVPVLRASVALGLVLLAQCSGPRGPIDGNKAMAHVRALVGFGPRPFGSDALAKTADYIVEQGKQAGVEVKRHEVLHEKEKKTIRNLYAQIDGDDPQNGPILVIGAHYDTKLTSGHADAAHNIPFVGAIDGGGGPAVLLELARELKGRAQKPKCNIWLYWIDAEESLDWTWNDERALLGSQAFCKWLSETKQLARVKAFVLLDLIGSKDYKVDKDGNSDSRLQELFGRAAKAMGEDTRLYEFPTELELGWYREKGINWGTTDDHKSFTRYGVPSVLLIDFARRQPPQEQNLKPGQQPLIDPRYQQWWHTADDTLDAMDPAALAFAGNLVLQALPELEAFVLGRK
ncbi:MAG: M28 family peptidase [Planctomycetota bacterium]